MPPYAVIRRAVTSLALLAMGLAFAQGAMADEAVRVRGSTTFLPLVQSVAEDYMTRHAGKSVAVAGGGSTRGYKAVLDGTADIAFMSGPVPEPLRLDGERRGLKLHTTIVGYRALVAAVHPSQPTNDVSLAELRAIFTGRMAKWPATHVLTPSPIQVFMGRPTSGVTLVWHNLVLHGDDTFTPKAPVMPEQARAEKVASTPNSITYLPMGTPHSAKTKILLVNGVAPTVANVLNRTYPLRAELTLVTRDKPTAATAAFVKAFSEPQPGWRLDGLILAPPSHNTRGGGFPKS